MRALVCAALFWGAASGAWASEDLARRLAEVLRIAEVVDILRDEGLAYGDSMDRDMLGGTGGVYFRDQVAVIYRAEDMVAALTDAMAQHMTAAALRDLHPEVFRGGPRAGLQLPRRPAGGLRGLHSQPGRRGLEARQDPLRRRRGLGRHARAASSRAAPGGYPGRQDRHRRRLQGRPPHPLADRLRQTGRALRCSRLLLRLGDPGLQHLDLDGPAHPQRASVLRPVRARG